MQTRNKMDVAREIEQSRAELFEAWRCVSTRNPIAITALAVLRGVRRWRVRAEEKSRAADGVIRASPHRFIGIALAIGVVAGLIVRAAKLRGKTGT
jgi:hypothetical protein